jgi:hypothetical protein
MDLEDTEPIHQTKGYGFCVNIRKITTESLE